MHKYVRDAQTLKYLKLLEKTVAERKIFFLKMGDEYKNCQTTLRKVIYLGSLVEESFNGQANSLE